MPWGRAGYPSPKATGRGGKGGAVGAFSSSSDTTPPGVCVGGLELKQWWLVPELGVGGGEWGKDPA